MRAAKSSRRNSRPPPGTAKTRSTIANAKCCGSRAKAVASSDIARQLFLSEGTVRNYLSEAIGKLGAANRIEAARIARQNGWL